MNNSVAELLLVIVGVVLFIGFQGLMGLLFFGIFVILASLLFWFNRKSTKQKGLVKPEKTAVNRQNKSAVTELALRLIHFLHRFCRLPVFCCFRVI
jgi:ABC-type uncharacterized transport system permease subunit